MMTMFTKQASQKVLFSKTNSYLSNTSASSFMRTSMLQTQTGALRMFSSKIFVQGLPVDWDENDINARFSLAGKLETVHFVKNSTGMKTGKVLIEFTEKDSADQAITRFDNQAIDGQICSVKPWINRANRGDNDDQRQSASILARRVYLMNVPYTA